MKKINELERNIKSSMSSRKNVDIERKEDACLSRHRETLYRHSAGA